MDLIRLGPLADLRKDHTWLGEVEAAHVPELVSFVAGIQQDKAALLAGLILPWSIGPAEGHVNRLKLIERSSMVVSSSTSFGNKSFSVPKSSKRRKRS